MICRFVGDTVYRSSEGCALRNTGGVESSCAKIAKHASDLVFLKTILPHGGVWSNAIFTVVYQNIHRTLLHRLAHVQIVVVVVCEDLLHGTCSTGLERFDILLRRLPLFHFLEHFLQIFCETPAVSRDRQCAHLPRLTLDFGLE